LPDSSLAGQEHGRTIPLADMCALAIMEGASPVSLEVDEVVPVLPNVRPISSVPIELLCRLCS
jgi:hypothetical protein